MSTETAFIAFDTLLHVGQYGQRGECFAHEEIALLVWLLAWLCIFDRYLVYFSSDQRTGILRSKDLRQESKCCQE